MKIAHLLPYSVIFPLKKHSGRYEWALRLARRQAADGHEVVFYAGPGSRDDSGIIWRSRARISEDNYENNLALISEALKNGHDVYHSHFDYLHYLVADNTDVPIVVTQHWFPDQQIGDAAKLNKKANTIAVPATDLMAGIDERLGIKHSEIIRQGIDLDRFRPIEHAGRDRLIFVGRIAPWKGVLEAVRIAKTAGENLDIVGKLNSSEAEYWRKIEPYIDGDQIRYLGPKNQEEIARLLAEAKAFIFPSQSPDAAPQAPIEAQACGTPVIMSDVGATREWLEPGVTGFIAKSEGDYLQAIKDIPQINRDDCRRFAEKFDFNDLVRRYYELYASLV